MLCYPPPGSKMAAKSLSTYTQSMDRMGGGKGGGNGGDGGGGVVIHIGEWRGLTGDAAFETALQRYYELGAWKFMYFNGVLRQKILSVSALRTDTLGFCDISRLLHCVSPLCISPLRISPSYFL
jgi:hypothetical protein